MTSRTLPAALALASALVLATPASAAPSPADTATPAAAPAPIRAVAGVLFTGTAGTNDVTVTNPDGSTASGSLSGRYEAFAGAEFPLAPNGLALRLTAGIHSSANFSGSGGSERMTSFPFEATIWYPVNDRMRIGAGARYAMRSRFSGAVRRRLPADAPPAARHALRLRALRTGCRQRSRSEPLGRGTHRDLLNPPTTRRLAEQLRQAPFSCPDGACAPRRHSSATFFFAAVFLAAGTFAARGSNSKFTLPSFLS
jgi:hypothetical protein